VSDFQAPFFMANNVSNVIVQNAQLLRAGMNRQILKDGSQVAVRILNDKGGGKYEGLVAGARVNITSNQVFSKGDIFTGNIRVRDGQIFITPKTENQAVQNQEIKFTLISGGINSQNLFEPLTDSSLFSFVQNLGLIPDNLSYNIILNFKQLGMKFIPELMNKIYDMAKKYPGREKKAIELISNLLSKGVSVTEEDIESLLLSVYEGEEFSLEEGNKDARVMAGVQELFTSKEIKAFFESIFNAGDEDSSDGGNDSTGFDILSISNTLGSRKDMSGSGSWILFPFEVVQASEKTGRGVFRILLSNEKKIIKFCVNCEHKKSEYNFCLLFQNNQCNALKVNVEKDGKDISDSESFIYNLKKQLLEKNLPVNVEWEEKEKIAENASGLEQIFSLGGTV
jgi:hypothetical protein